MGIITDYRVGPPPQPSLAGVDLRFYKHFDSNLTAVSDLGLVWDETYASGITEAQALAALSIDGSGNLNIDTAAAVSAGADADFSCRFWLSGENLLLPGQQWSWRALVNDNGNSNSTNYCRIGLLLYHCDTDGVPTVSPLTNHTQADAGTYIRSYLNTANYIFNSWFDTTWIAGSLANGFYTRSNAQNARHGETCPNGEPGLRVITHTANYTSVSSNLTDRDQRAAGEEFSPSTSTFRFALVIDHVATSTVQMDVTIERMELVGGYVGT